MIYRGSFAEGIDADHPSWTAWIAAQRDRTRALYVQRATARLQDPSLGRSAERFEAQRLLDVDPSNETAVRSQMLGNAMSGEPEASSKPTTISGRASTDPGPSLRAARPSCSSA